MRSLIAGNVKEICMYTVRSNIFTTSSQDIFIHRKKSLLFLIGPDCSSNGF